jgi:oligopeptide transport system substrate-binding protein
MAIPATRNRWLTGLLLLLAACRAEETGPIVVSAIGGPPKMADPNRQLLDAPSAFLLQSTAQGLVRFNAAGEVEPALAQGWIVSDDGLRYTFRLARAEWPGGGPVTAEQVVARLRAAAAPSSRNPVKPLLGAIDEIVAMTDEVLEISLKSPRPNFLQLLAQPQMAIIRKGIGSGPYLAAAQSNGEMLLSLPAREGEEEPEAASPPIILRGEPAAMATARFSQEGVDLVLGGGAGDLPIARAAAPPANSLVFDPVAGLFGLTFVSAEGPFASAEGRQALSMALDRGAIVAALGVPGLVPRESTISPDLAELPQPSAPAWTAAALPERRAAARRVLAEAAQGRPVTVRVSLPDGPGYRLLFAHLRRDWATIGADARRVGPGEPADLRLIDEVAPVSLASWYLRHFTCEVSRVCDPAADELMAAARIAPTPENRRALLASADRILAGAAPFIPIAAPVRWSLVSPRLTGFRPNAFSRHPAGELVRSQP